MILIINPDGTGSTRETLTFAEAQEIVGGYVELHEVQIKQKRTQFLGNEDGLALGLPSNPLITEQLQGRVLQSPRGSVGTWIVLTGKDIFK